MEHDATMDGFTALIYARGGQRVRADISICADARPCAGVEPVFCEAALADALARIYPGMPVGIPAGMPGVRARLFRTEGIWRSLGAPCPELCVRPCEGERAVVRGIYALAGQQRPCFARETRAIWNELMAAWHERGLRVQLFCRGERTLAYAVLGAPEEDGRYRRLHEFAALPGSGVALETALEAAHASGVCPPEVTICGSALELQPA